RPQLPAGRGPGARQARRLVRVLPERDRAVRRLRGRGVRGRRGRGADVGRRGVLRGDRRAGGGAGDAAGDREDGMSAFPWPTSRKRETRSSTGEQDFLDWEDQGGSALTLMRNADGSVDVTTR